MFTGRIDLRTFYWRRVFRIVPVYVVVIVLYVAATHLHGQHEKWVELRGGLPWFLTMMNEYVREPNNGTVFTHSWSLGVEEKCYLLWPVLGFVAARALRVRSLVLGALFAMLVVPVLLGHTYLARAYFGLLMGCLLGLVLSGPMAARVDFAMRRTPAIGVLLLPLAGFLLEYFSKDFFVLFSLFVAVFPGYLILVPSLLAGVHAWAPLRWLGRRSYAMYLVHILCLMPLRRTCGLRLLRGLRLCLLLRWGFPRGWQRCFTGWWKGRRGGRGGPGWLGRVR